MASIASAERRPAAGAVTSSAWRGVAWPGLAGGNPADIAGKTLTICHRRNCLERSAAVGDNSRALKKKNSLLRFVP